MNNSEITCKLIEGVAVLYPGPYLNQLRGERIEERCNELLATGLRRIVINLGATELINSIGISILLGVIEAVNNAEGKLLLSNLSSSNRELFEMLGLMAHAEIEETEESALARLGPFAAAQA